jgi:hypothetical protein
MVGFSFNKVISGAHRCNECSNLAAILDPLGRFDTTADVDGIGAYNAHCVSRVVYAQATT